MPLPSVRACLVAAVTASAHALAASPAQATFIAAGQDPVGDTTGGHPARDLLGVSLAYDKRTGALRGGVKLAAAPFEGAAANLTLFAGRRSATGSGCNAYPAIGFGTQTDLRGVRWVRFAAAGAAPQDGAATKTYDGPIEEYEARAATLRGARPECVIAQLSDPATGAVHDVAGPYAVRALPELELALGTLPTMRPNRTRTVRVALRNPGDAATGRLRLSIGGARGMSIRAARTVPSIAAGSRRTVAIRVTLSRRARSLTDLRVTARNADGLQARDEGRLVLVKNGGSGGSGGGGKGGSKLCYRYTWTPPYSALRPC